MLPAREGADVTRKPFKHQGTPQVRRATAGQGGFARGALSHEFSAPTSGQRQDRRGDHVSSRQVSGPRETVTLARPGRLR
jgi:hypothetical protein